MGPLQLIPVSKTDLNKLDENYKVSEATRLNGSVLSICVQCCFQYDRASIPALAWQLIDELINSKLMTTAVFHESRRLSLTEWKQRQYIFSFKFEGDGR